MVTRHLAVLAIATILAVQIVRNAVVRASAELSPASAARIWASHPDVEISLALADIGRAARERKAVDATTFAMIKDAAIKAPLSPAPYLVQGVKAQTMGDAQTAVRAFAAAQWRDPRSLPAAYFLGAYYLSRGSVFEGLKQTAILGRLSPGGPGIVAPFLAQYARNPSHWPQMRAFFQHQPDFEEGVLAALAADSGNAQAILAIADASHRAPDSPWLQVLLNNLVNSGDYRKARVIWNSVGGGSGDLGQIFDADFSKSEAPGPFNWTLTSSGVGLAERKSGSGLHVIFYGNQDGVLASQLLLLPPGRYRLDIRVAGLAPQTDSLHWSLRCDKQAEPFSDVSLAVAARSGWSFEVPDSCAAQWLELSGRAGDIAEQSEAVIARLRLSRAGQNV